MLTFTKDVAFFLEISVTDSNGDFVTDLTVNYDIRNSDTNVSVVSGSMTGEGNAYKIEVTLSTEGQYRVLYTTPSGYENAIETIEIIPESSTTIAEAVWNALISTHSTVGSFGELFKLVAGLCQSNYRIFNPVYSGTDMTSATIKIYPSAADVNADTNSLASYLVTATYAAGKMSTYKVTKV